LIHSCLGRQMGRANIVSFDLLQNIWNWWTGSQCYLNLCTFEFVVFV
jgi:hypothetical protein